MLLHASEDPSILLNGFVHGQSLCRLSVAYGFHLQLHLCTIRPLLAACDED